LGGAALHGRFAHPDLSSILNANIRRTAMHAANEATSLTQGTGVWAAIGSQPLTNTAEGAMNPITPTTAPPGLPADLEALMRSLKMPHARALGPELIATARAQRWVAADIIKALFTEECAGRTRRIVPPQGRGIPSRNHPAPGTRPCPPSPAPTQWASSPPR
jgi:hypothetical protein